MRQFIFAGFMAAALLAPSAFAHDGHKHDPDESVTLQGEIVDMACYMAHEGKGPKHKKCAETCALGGSPLGLLTADGSLYLLVEDHNKKKAYDALKKKAGETVSVTGKKVSRGGVQALVVLGGEASAPKK